MIGRRTAIGVAVLCALVVSAFAVASASAGETAYTCTTKASVKKFTDAHCLTEGASPTRGHEKITVDLTTEITGTSDKTAAGTTAGEVSKLKGALSGVVTEVQCTSLHGLGSLKNRLEAGTSWVEGNGVINYSGCSVTQPAGKGCVVTGGKISTKNLFATTKGQAAKSLKFEPGEGAGGKFAEITISGCSIGSLNNTFPVTGSLVASTNGATTTTTHAGVTTQNTLKFGGVKAGLEGALTISMNEKAGGLDLPGEPIVLTP